MTWCELIIAIELEAAWTRARRRHPRARLTRQSFAELWNHLQGR